MFVDMTADIAHTLHPHRQLLVAFSGGLDSTVLLHQLVLLREQDPSLTLRAVHVHHGLSAHADDWVAHCRQICQQWQVPLVVHHVTLARGGLGVEAHARAARYQAFQDTLNAGEVLVTAQHQDDQCETLLLALKRGSGPTGLSAMAPSSAFADSRLLRPLLNETRESLRQWALAHQLSWIEDESNQDDTYDRNFLRLRVIPLLRERWLTEVLRTGPDSLRPACRLSAGRWHCHCPALGAGRPAGAGDGRLAPAFGVQLEAENSARSLWRATIDGCSHAAPDCGAPDAAEPAASEAAFRTGDEGNFAVELECVENSTHISVLFYLRSLGPRVSMSSKVWFSPAMPQTNE